MTSKYGDPYWSKKTEERSDTVRAFMCLTDWQHEVRRAVDGVKVYPREEGFAYDQRTCIYECGYVEVEIKLIRVVKERSI